VRTGAHRRSPGPREENPHRCSMYPQRPSSRRSAFWQPSKAPRMCWPAAPISSCR